MARGETYNEFVDKFKPKLTTSAERYELSEQEKEIVKRLGEQSEHGKILR